MTLADLLSINPLPASEAGLRCYELIGSVDAHSAPALNQLRGVESSTRVKLDFIKVERVNSMGLSLLLKLFEEWEKRGIKIEVENPNRMVAMLFKITGLGRFLTADVKLPSERSGGAQPSVVSSVRAAAKPAEAAPAGGKLNFVASLQVGAQLSGWYLLNTYLQRRLQRAIHFEQLPAGRELGQEVVDLLFAKPFEACAMMQKRGFIPLLRPVGEADEVVIVMRADDPRTLADLPEAQAVTASQGSFVYVLGRFLCDENGLDSSRFQQHFAGNEIKALQMLLKQQADVLFMLKKTYYGLSGLTRGNTRVVDESDTQFAFHLLCIDPAIAAQKDDITQTFLNMAEDDQGRQILKDIQLEGWCVPQEGELGMLMRLYERYSE
ncbi:anti-anti-sigma factor [Methylomagnum ishizawai]|uniref:Anti-anti-sigma factor n=1 Tax=Methylomagnum ishizawai TaxID=1760988 RepID=A0A1Y6CTV1_9GAMM|nr:PhnD/SsuA/transferrin family substrate-binding protein [Methylomagnum ishizawai]SMF93726.1 anti-anti-sigma factor [Methylomagnum ishizawai]